MNRRRPILVTLFAVALVALALSAAGQIFRERTEVLVVEVPVHVIGKDGRPVRGLTAEDFRIREGKKKHPITGFEVVDLAEVNVGEERFVSDLRAVARRHFLLLFDLSFSDADSVVRSRSAAHRLVAEELHPTDMVAVAVYTATYGSRLILSFTSDREQISLAIDSLGAPQLIDRSTETLSVVLGSLRQDLHALSARTHEGGRQQAGNVRRGERLDATVGEMVESMRDIGAMENRNLDSHDRERVVALTRSFADLGRLMRSVSGRKHVVYLSEGFDSRLLLGEIEGEALEVDPSLSSAPERTRQGMEEGKIWRADSDRLYGNTRLQGDLNLMVEEFRRADCVIHAVDIGGVRAAGGLGPERASGEDGLFIMANETGGELYRNYNDLGAAMERMLETTSVTYLLAFEPPKVAADGSYHPIEVELTRSIPGAKLVHRQGYFAPSASGFRTPVEEKMLAAELLLAGEAGGPVAVSVLAAPFKGPGERAFVPVLVEADGESLLVDHAAGLLSAEIYVYALDPAGAAAGFLAQNVGVNLLQQEATVRRGGLKYYGELELPPGRYELRVLVRNAQTRGHGLAAFPLTVPDYAGAAGPVLLPPFSLEPGEGWLLARAEKPSFPYPFVLEGEPFVPSARLRLGPEEEASLCLMAYGAGGRFEGQVLTGAGAAAAGGRFELVREVPTGAAGLTEAVMRFHPQGLPPGDYQLQVALVDPVSGARTESLLPLSVERR